MIMFKRRVILFFNLLLFAFLSHAQTVKVKKETARIKSEYADGFEVELQANNQEAEDALTKLMKSFGKTKQGEDYIVVAEPTINGTVYVSPVYARTKQLGNIVSAWVGIRSKEWDANVENVNKDIERLMYDFGVNFHKEKIQKQIDESVRALQAVERQQQRLTNQNRDLNTRIDDNKREKIQLEKSIENNKVELETLIKKMEKNRKDQDSVAIAGEQIKKVIEMHRDRQKKVN
jgi:hypothetical protein